MNRGLLEECVRVRRHEHPDERYGQAVYNIMLAYRFNQVRVLAGTDLDPFYDDGKVEAFLEHLDVT